MPAVGHRDEGGVSSSSAAPEASLQAWIVARLAALTHVPPDRVDPRASFHENGLTSALALELVAALGVEVGRTLSPTIVWERPTAIALARWLASGSPATGETEPGRGTAPTTRAEPIAVIGIGCRFPGGADTPDRFWDLLRRGVDAVTSVPKDRWDGEAYFDADLSTPGKTNSRRGGFLDRVDTFDPLFFGISPREAVDVDPQQRLALELAWEALEDAGVVPSSLRETTAGVFMGAIFGDYERLLVRRGAAAATPHTSTGTARGIVANRVSYALGLQGPSIVVDTACSSSLVALHLACHSLQRGESSIALAGGVQLNLDPDTGVEMSKFGALSPDGRCATFDARANGYVRGEGGAVVVLKPLSVALRNGDRVYGVIRGSAVNNDGPSNGLTAPNPEAQRKVLATACRSAAIDPASVDYVELHGTGTVLGDPVEAGALGSVYGAGRPPERPLLVGSVKTNLGHLEGAAGIAGLVKTLLALHHRALPPSLHFERPNPYIDFAASRLEVVTAHRPWPSTDGVMPRAGVSAFGFGGTNAHVVVEGLPEAGSVELVPISGSDEASLRARVAEVRAALSRSGEPSDPVTPEPGWFAATDAHRIAVVAPNRVELDEGLARWQARIPDRRVFAGRRTHAPLRPVFVFAGFGAQWYGMGRRLYAEEAVFRAALERCDASLRADYGWSLLDELWAAPERQRLDDPDESDVLFPILVALQIALTDLFVSWGVEPAAVVGQSIGEVAAAYTAGILDTRDAMRVVAELGRAHRASVRARRFLFALTDAPPATIDEVLHPFAGRAYRAGHLAPSATSVSGEATAVQEILAHLRDRGFRGRELAHVVSHCPLAAPFAAAMTAPLATLAPVRGRIPMISTTSGVAVEGTELTAAYWRENLVNPTRLSPCIADLARAGHRHFVELGPHAILQPFLEATLSAQGLTEPAVVLASQLRDADGRATALRALGRLFTLGTSVSWAAVSSATETSAPLLLPLSARSEASLRASAERHRDLLRAHTTGARDVCFSTTFHRERHDLRLVVAARDRQELADKLDAFASGEVLDGVTSARRSPRAGRAVFVFPGQGSQWLGMGREMANEPVFRDALARCDAAIRAHAGFSVLDLLFTADDAAALDPVDVVQPALFAMQVAISALWRSWGIEPAVVVGHSMGEIAAAHVAGALSLDDAARIACARSRLVRERNPGNGGMALVELSPSEAEAAIAGHASRLAVAAINGPRAVVLSGDRDALSAVLEELRHRGVWVRSINVDYASHSPQMDVLSGPLREILRSIRPASVSVPFFSTVTARREDGTRLDAAYWATNLRAPVRFAEVIEALAKDHGHDLFVEISAHPVLTPSIQRSLQHVGVAGHALPSLRREGGERYAMLGTLGAMVARGASAELRRLYPDGGRRVALPTYPFGRERFWFEAGARDTSPRSDAAPGVTPRAAAPVDAPPPPAPSASIVDRLAQAPRGDRARILEAHVRMRVAGVLGLRSSHPLDPDQGLTDLGMSSLLSGELVRRLSTDLGRTLAATLAFDHPTIRALTTFLSADDQADAPATATAPMSPAPYTAEPIALVGLGCRFPGDADDAESFWSLLVGDGDALGDVPAERWDADAYFDPDRLAPGKTYTRRGAFLRAIDGFDAAFFRISPREAHKLDPQQRLLLEVAWEALEDAGIGPATLAGSETGVFVGASPSEYLARLRAAGVAGDDGYALTGNLAGTLSGRLSYVLGLRGPNLVVDTACSASLVALHLACQSLRARECDVALAGGVSLILSADGMVELCKASALSADGRCKTFDASADGYARGEGCGVVVLKRLSDALAAGDRIRAVVRGSAVNHDGRSAGLTAPSGPAQQALITKALGVAGVDPAEVAFIESHGTGTALGDPIELDALAAVYGRAPGRSGACVVGAVKTVIGHLELAAGIAGVIKTVLCLERGEIPSNRNLIARNPELRLEGTAFVLPATRSPWPAGYARRIATVSSFGIGGTNAHAVLERAPAVDAPRANAAPDAPLVLPISARAPEALRALVHRYHALLSSDGGPSWTDLAQSAALGRSHHEHRLAIVARDREAARASLASFLAGESREGLSHGRRDPAQRPRVAFVFGGQGSQWVGMGLQARARSPVFRAAFDACADAIQAHGGAAIVEELSKDADRTRLDVPEVLQPALFAIQVAQAAVWRAWGVEPEAVVGHSLGAIAAAHVAGALTLADAARIVCERSRLIGERAVGAGMMALVALPLGEAAAAIAPYGERLSIAVENSPGSTVLSGDRDALEALLEALERRGVWCRKTKVDFAFHSAHMDPVLDELGRRLADLVPGDTQVPYFSTVTGRREDGPQLGAAYWVRNVREPVRFAPAIQALAEDGLDRFLELGPHPVLVPAVEDTLRHHGRAGVAIASGHRARGDEAALVGALAALYGHGVDVDWARVYVGGARHAALPTYPWQRQRYWVDVAGPVVASASSAAVTEPERAFGQQLRALPATERPGALLDHVARTVLRTLGLPAEQALDRDADLFDQGLDSLMAMELASRLSADLGAPLSPRLAFQHPTIAELGHAVARRILPEDAPAPELERPHGTPWIVVPRPDPRAPVRLVCFPYAGGGPGLFRHWADALPAEVCAIRAPGRESRSDEAPHTSMSELLDALLPELLPYLDRPFALFGYSLGAVHAFELARTLAQRGLPRPRALLVAACAAPDRLPPTTDATLTDDALLALMAQSGVASEVLTNPDMRGAILRLLRADAGQLRGYSGTPPTGYAGHGPSLDVPIIAYASESDPLAPLPTAMAWNRWTRGSFSLRQMPGAHFFLHTHPEVLLAQMRRDLEDL